MIYTCLFLFANILDRPHHFCQLTSTYMFIKTSTCQNHSFEDDFLFYPRLKDKSEQQG